MIWLRLLVVITGVVLLINGCNSLLSQHFGTHRLHTFSAREALAGNIGDADYVEIKGVWQTGDYIIVPPKNASDKPVLIYPLVGVNQLTTLDAGGAVPTQLVAWTRDFDPACDDSHTCAPRREVVVRGVVREPNEQKMRAGKLPTDSYAMADRPIYLEAGQKPLAWYWNLLMLVGGVAMAVGIEAYYFRKSKTTRNEK